MKYRMQLAITNWTRLCRPQLKYTSKKGLSVCVCVCVRKGCAQCGLYKIYVHVCTSVCEGPARPHSSNSFSFSLQFGIFARAERKQSSFWGEQPHLNTSTLAHAYQHALRARTLARVSVSLSRSLFLCSAQAAHNFIACFCARTKMPTFYLVVSGSVCCRSRSREQGGGCRE